MRKVLSVLLVLVSATVSFGQYGVSRNGRSGSSGYSNRSRSAASARPPTPYDYISRAYTEAYIDKRLGAGYGARAMQSVDAGYAASGGYSETTIGSGVIVVPVGNAYTGNSGIRFSAPFTTK
jgi:hypothetical protein